MCPLTSKFHLTKLQESSYIGSIRPGPFLINDGEYGAETQSSDTTGMGVLPLNTGLIHVNID